MAKRAKSSVIITCNDIILFLNQVIDDAILNKKLNFNLYNYLIDEKVNLKEIQDFNKNIFIKTIQYQIEEFDDYLKGGNQILKEAYSEYNKPEIRKIRNYIQQLLDDAKRYELFKINRK